MSAFPWKSILGSLAGLVLGAVLVGLFQWIGHKVVPIPADIDTTNMDAVKKAMVEGRIPAVSIGSVLVAWFFGAFGGSSLGTCIGGTTPGFLVGGVLALMGLMQLVMIPHPVWFIGGTAIVFPVGTLLGIAVAGGFKIKEVHSSVG